ncbi:hypothetical protein ACFQMG_05980 [Kitasatospora paranensis]|uniref:Uncharacterized protein n=1 Tax=Kitasatospora paranensis TaxID=258053 RepID=A0ABW2FSM2_9ACTN
MRLLERIFGPQLSYPESRFATEVALRALHLARSERSRKDDAAGP